MEIDICNFLERWMVLTAWKGLSPTYLWRAERFQAGNTSLVGCTKFKGFSVTSGVGRESLPFK